jgi:hypothetical protein
MAQLVVSTAAAAATFVATGGNAFAAQLAFAGASAAFGAYKASRQRIDGPRLTDAQVTGASYGEPIPYVLGARRVAGQVWWQSARRENATTSGGGGKGNGPKQTTFTYERDFLFGLTSNPKGVLTRVWLNGKLVWSILGDQETIDNSENTDLWSRITFYTGADDQLPDPVYEAAVGTADACAYRGRSSVFIEALQLGSSGQIPNLTFEVSGGDLGLSTFCLDGAAPLVAGGLPIETFYTSTGTTSAPDNWISPVATITPAHPEGKPAMLGSNSGSALFDKKTRQFSTQNRRIKYIQFDFILLESLPPSTDDGMIVTLYDESDFPVFSFNPRREIEFDSAGRPVLGFGNGTFSVGSGQLPTDTWLRFRADYSTTANQAAWAIRQISDDALVLSGTTAANAPAGRVASKIEFFVDNVGNPLQATMGTAYVCVDIGLTVSDITEEGLTLRQAVESLCARADMPAGTYDASDLDAITQPVRSLIIGQPGATRAALEQLQAVFFFDATLSDKLYFRPRATAPAAVLPRDELGAGEGQPQDDAFPITVESDIELPPQVVVRYANVLDDYQVGTEYSDRLVSGQVSQAIIDVAVGLEPPEAKAAADGNLLDGLAGLVKSRVSVPMRYSAVEPGDIVQIVDDDFRAYRMRVTGKSDSLGLLTWDVSGDDDGALLSPGITDESYAPNPNVTQAGETAFRALDIPLLREQDDLPGYYVAVKPAGAVWPGAQLFSSAAGTNFQPVVQISERAVFGVTTSALPSFAGGGVDESGSVLVDVGAGQLSSSNLAAVLADQTINAGIVGNEVIRWVDATLISTDPNIYRLRRLLRGQRGTEWARSGHAIGDRFVAFGLAGMRRIFTDQADVGAPRILRAVTLGRPLSSAQDVPFTNTGVSQAPLSVANLRISKPAAGQYVATWERRSRRPVVWRDGAAINLPLAEGSERYQYEVRDDAGNLLESGQVVQPTVTITATGSPAPAIDGGTLTVWQMSNAVGRGRPASLVIVDDGKPPPDAPPEAASIYGALRSWWALDDNDASSTYVDLHGSNPMTLRTGGSTTATSVISSNASTDARVGRGAAMARTVNRAAYIPRSNTALDLTDTSFTFGGWMRIGLAAATASFLMGRAGSAAGQFYAYLILDGADNTLRADITTDGTTATRTRTAGTTAWSSSELQLITFTLDRAANEIVLRLRRPGANSGNLVKQSAAFAGALFTGSTAANFFLGHLLSSDGTFFAGDRNGIHSADECFFLDSAITDAEFNYLYNSFNGRSYAQLVADAT